MNYIDNCLFIHILFQMLLVVVVVKVSAGHVTVERLKFNFMMHWEN